ncbi:hypothetical protein MRB53_038099 [Persea americana]|nr:hypothetical protein MRB53_038099 [Persea americana]
MSIRRSSRLVECLSCSGLVIRRIARLRRGELDALSLIVHHLVSLHLSITDVDITNSRQDDLLSIDPSIPPCARPRPHLHTVNTSLLHRLGTTAPAHPLRRQRPRGSCDIRAIPVNKPTGRLLEQRIDRRQLGSSDRQTVPGLRDVGLCTVAMASALGWAGVMNQNNAATSNEDPRVQLKYITFTTTSSSLGKVEVAKAMLSTNLAMLHKGKGHQQVTMLDDDLSPESKDKIQDECDRLPLPKYPGVLRRRFPLCELVGTLLGYLGGSKE